MRPKLELKFTMFGLEQKLLQFCEERFIQGINEAVEIERKILRGELKSSLNSMVD